MIDLKRFWTPEKIILIIFIFIISISIILSTILFENFFIDYHLIKLILISSGVMGILSTIIIIFVYYLAILFAYLRKSNVFYCTIIILFGGLWSIMTALKEKSWLVLLGNLAWVGFAVSIERWVTKSKNKNSKN